MGPLLTVLSDVSRGRVSSPDRRIGATEVVKISGFVSCLGAG